MTVPQEIPFAVSAVVMLWAIWGTIWAFRGSSASGQHEIFETASAAPGPETETVEPGTTPEDLPDTADPTGPRRMARGRQLAIGIPLGIVAVVVIVAAIIIAA